MKHPIRLYTLSLLFSLLTPLQAHDGYELWDEKKLKDHIDLAEEYQLSQTFEYLTLSSSRYGADSTSSRISPAVPTTILKFYYQDSSVNLTHLYGQLVNFRELKAGPTDNELGIAEDSCVRLEGERKNYTLSFNANPRTPEFDAMHTYTVTRLVFDMYKNDLDKIQNFVMLEMSSLKHLKQFSSYRVTQDINNEIKKLEKFQSLQQALANWTRKPFLKIYPHYNEENNAYYTPENHSLRFGAYIKNEQIAGFLCSSFDIVSHEAGHAVLAFLTAKLFEGQNLQTEALHEAFGDLTAMFNVLNQQELRNDIIKDTRGDLSQASFLPLIGEEYGKLVTGEAYLRNIQNTFTLQDLLRDDPEAHSLSRVFSGAVYDVLVQLFAQKAKKDEKTLKEVNDQVRLLVLKSFMSISKDSPQFIDVLNEMLRWSEEDQSLKNQIFTCFEQRGIIEKVVKSYPVKRSGYQISPILTALSSIIADSYDA